MPAQASPTDGAKSVAHFKDLSMQDVWTAVHFLTHGVKNSPCLVNNLRAPPTKSLPGIKINCVGDRNRFHPDKDPNSDAAIYEAVTVPNGDGYPYQSQLPSILASMMGLPWLCRFVDNSSDLWAKDASGRYSVADSALVANPELGHLHCLLQGVSRESLSAQGPSDPGATALCLTMIPGPHFGSVILVHMFGERIRPEHVKMTGLFAEERRFSTVGTQKINLTGFGEYWD